LPLLRLVILNQKFNCSSSPSLRDAKTAAIEKLMLDFFDLLDSSYLPKLDTRVE